MESFIQRIIKVPDPNIPKNLIEKNPELYEEYINAGDQLEIDIYVKLSDMASLCGLGPGTLGMAIIALTMATDLCKRCGIEGKEFEQLVTASMKSIDALYKNLQEKRNGTK